jgi:nicotinate phosphoribosyltransferase
MVTTRKVAALRGYENANAIALDLWEEVYPESLLFALTDTFSTEAFFKASTNVSHKNGIITLEQNFAADPDRPRRWKGLRQDSGDPFVFAPHARDMYLTLGIDHREKTIIFSDALNLDKALQLKKQCDEIGFKCAHQRLLPLT